MLLYSFFPQVDPKGMLMRIPHLALSAKKYSTIQRIAESSLMVGTLPLLLLPNWSFDYAYALHMMGEKEKARQQVLESLMRWPQVLRLFHQHAVLVLILRLTYRKHNCISRNHFKNIPSSPVPPTMIISICLLISLFKEKHSCGQLQKCGVC